MKIAYLILAHRCPCQLFRLVKRLDSNDSGFFVHLDKKANFEAFHGLFNNYHRRLVTFVRREDSSWGGIGIVKATLNGLKEIVEFPQKFDYIVLLSGHCYPIHSQAYIQKFFEENKGKQFLSYFSLPSDIWKYGGMDRLEKYHFHFIYSRSYPPTFPPKTLMGRTLNAFFKLYFNRKREYPRYLKPYGGFQWFNITLDAAKYILKFNQEHPDYMKYHQYTFVSDETFFQSILLNAADKKFSENIVCNDLRFVDWTKHESARPAVLERADFNRITQSGQLFARKFEMHVDYKILDMLDEHIDQESELLGGQTAYSYPPALSQTAV
jgi:hypothetical protein